MTTGTAQSAPGPRTRRNGALLFARYAYPPNALGYCGPDRPGQLLEQASAGVDDAELRGMLRGFEGAWPYLELIAGGAGIADPLDARVVEAYWIGNDLLAAVGTPAFGRSLEDRFHRRLGARSWACLAESIPAGAVPHHSLHVFGVYPWTGLLRAGRGTQPLHVLERCRIRWGRVLRVAGPTALVSSQPLAWDGRVLSLGAPRVEEVRLRADPGALAPELAAGDWCALHWDWACDRLDARRLTALRRWTGHTLDLVNALPHPGPAAALS